MESNGGGIYTGEACECEMVFESFIVSEIIALSQENPSVLESDLSEQRSFELSRGEVTYFQSEIVSPTRSTQALDNIVRSKSVSPEYCDCDDAYENTYEKWSWRAEHDSGQAQSTVSSVNSFHSTSDQLKVISVQNPRSSAPATSMVESLYHEDVGNICTQDFAESLNVLSLSEMGDRSKKDDVSYPFLVSSDSNDPNTLADESQPNPLENETKGCIPREEFLDALELKEEGPRLLLEDATSKQKLRHILKSESCTNPHSSESQDVSSTQRGTLADDEGDLACHVEERRHNNKSAAVCASDLPRYKWVDLKLEDSESVQAESNTNVTIDSSCTAPCMDLLKDQQVVEPLEFDKEFRIFDFSHGEGEQGVILPTGQRTYCPDSVVSQSNMRDTVVVAVQISTEENYTNNGEANHPQLLSESILPIGTAESFRETKSTSDLAVLTRDEIEFCLPPLVVNFQIAQAKNAEMARNPISSPSRKTLEPITRSTAFSFENQDKDLYDFGYGGPIEAASADNTSATVLERQILSSDGDASIAEALKVNNCAFKEELKVSSSINMAFVPVTLERSSEDFRPYNNGEARVGKGQEKIRQHLWCYLFENIKRDINELFCICDLESDAEKTKEALLVLDNARIDFEHLKARIDSFDRVHEGCSPSRTTSAMISNSFLSTKKYIQQRRPHSTAWEVRRMACSQDQTGPRNHAKGRQPDSSEGLLFQGSECVVASASPGQDECRDKESTVFDAELFTGRSFDSACEKAEPGSSFVNRHVSPTDFSERRACSKKRQVSARTSSVAGTEALKQKRNWNHTFSPFDTRSSRASRSPTPDRKSKERVRVLHDKLASPKWRMGSRNETKDVDGEQARANCRHTALDNAEVQRLSKSQEKLSRASERQAARSQVLRGSMHSQQEQEESRDQGGVAQIARRARDISSKLGEIRLVGYLNEEKRMLDLQDKLQDSGSQGDERRNCSKFKRKEIIAKEEDVQERGRQINPERSQPLTEVQRKKEVKMRQEEEEKIGSAIPEARATHQIRKKEAWVTYQQEEAQLLELKLSERLLESSQRRKIYLEKIKERALMDFEKQDNLSKDVLSECVRMQYQSLSFNRPVSRRQKATPNETLTNEGHLDGFRGGSYEGVGLVNLVENHKGTLLQTTKNKLKQIRQRLTSRKVEYHEPPSGIEGRGLGTATAIGGARFKIKKWMLELKCLQEIKKPESLTTSGLIMSEIGKYLEEREPMLHAARHQGLLDYIATALAASHSSKHEPTTFTVDLLRLLMVVLYLPANRSYFIARNLLPPLIPMLSAALRTFSLSDCVNNRGVLLQKNSVASKVGFSSSSGGKSTSVLVKEGEKIPEEKLKTVQEVLKGLLSVVSSIIGHTCIDDHIFQIQEDLAELVVACEVLRNLQTLFALYYRVQMEGVAIPSPIILGLRLLEVLTGPRGKILSAAHEMPINIVGRPLQPTPELESMQESLGSQKLVDVKKARSNGSSAEIGAPEPPDDMTKELEAKTSHINSQPDLGTGVQQVFQIGGKSQETLSSSSKLLLKDMEETGLVCLPSLLTSILLQANQRVTTDQVASVLQSNFEEVAISVLRVINNTARLNLSLVQNVLAFSDCRMEFFYLINFLLSHCTCKWKSNLDQIGALLTETLLLLGYAALLHPGNQVVLRWGKSPTILNKICDLPFAFFSDPKLTPILNGTLLSVCFGNERNRDIVQQELGTEMLLVFLKNSVPDPASAPPASITKSGGDDASVKPKEKLGMLDSESLSNSALDGSVLNHPADTFLRTLKKPIRLYAKSSSNLSITQTSSNGGTQQRNFRSPTSPFRSMSDRVALARQLQHVTKSERGVSSSHPFVSIKPTTLTVTQAISPGVPSRTPETKLVSFPPPVSLSLQNRFPVVLWPHAEEFLSTRASVDRTSESL